METVYLVVYDYECGCLHIHCTLGGIYTDKKIAEKRAKELDNNNIYVQRVIVKDIEINKDYKEHNRIYINEESEIFEYYD